MWNVFCCLIFWFLIWVFLMWIHSSEMRLRCGNCVVNASLICSPSELLVFRIFICWFEWLLWSMGFRVKIWSFGLKLVLFCFLAKLTLLYSLALFRGYYYFFFPVPLDIMICLFFPGRVLYIAKLDVFPVKIIKFSLMGMMLIAILEKKNAYERGKKKIKK